MIDAARLAARLEGCSLGRPLHVLRTVTSTNEVCKRLAVEGAPAGTVVVAWEQTKGRGRRGRTWYAPPGQGLCLSVLLRPAGRAETSGALALQAAHAVGGALASAGVPGVRVVPPNDVFARGRKIAGLLAEPRVGRAGVDFVVLGVGVNVRQNEASWAGRHLRRPATSCRIEGVDLALEEAAVLLLRALEPLA